MDVVKNGIFKLYLKINQLVNFYKTRGIYTLTSTVTRILQYVHCTLYSVHYTIYTAHYTFTLRIRLIK